jgi:hypothetical protein
MMLKDEQAANNRMIKKAPAQGVIAGAKGRRGQFAT